MLHCRKLQCPPKLATVCRWRKRDYATLIHQNFSVGDSVWDFCREQESLWRLGISSLHRSERRGAVEGAIDLNGVELRCTVGEVFPFRQTFGIELAGPPGSGECKRSDTQSRHPAILLLRRQDSRHHCKLKNKRTPGAVRASCECIAWVSMLPVVQEVMQGAAVQPISSQFVKYDNSNHMPLP